MSASRRLVNLLDILKEHAHKYVELGRWIQEHEGRLYMAEPEDGDPGRPLEAVEANQLRLHLKELHGICKRLGLNIAGASVENAMRSPPQNSREYNVYISVVMSELEQQMFLFVPASRVAYYDEPMLFGEAVHDKFPKAIADIEDAGKTLALGFGTSCVMHLMRVTEEGLKFLAKLLKIPYAPSWESYLSQIQKKIDAKHKTKGIQWKRDEKYFRDISGDLVTVKQAWRNPTMHIDRRYMPDEAEEILRAVRALMQRLASRA